MAEVVSAVLEIPPYQIEAIALDKPLECLDTSDAKSMLLQWNLDQTLVYKKFRFVGAFDGAAGDYDRVLKDFLSNSACMADLGGVTGNPAVPFKINMDELSTKVTSMDFFDRCVCRLHSYQDLLFDRCCCCSYNF